MTVVLAGLVITGALAGSAVGGDRYRDSSLADTYWDGESTATDCHWRMSGPEEAYIDHTGFTDGVTCWGTQDGEDIVAIFR